jgi:predicted dienelactone hydrolase
MPSPPYRLAIPLLLGLVLMGCADEPEDSVVTVDPFAWSVLEDGPFNTGFRSWYVVYEPPVGETRTIFLNVWYPTEAAAGEAVAYLDGLQPDPEAFGDAAAAEPVYTAGYPVQVYSHGDQGWGGTSADLMRAFASHGWVVIAPDHTGNTLVDNIQPEPTAIYVHRPSDITASLNALEALDSGDPLAAADTSRVLMSGHSFGAYTTWANSGATYDAQSLETHCLDLAEGSCSEEELAAFVSGELAEPRVSAGITLAGSISRGFFGPEGHLGVQGPMLLMSGTSDSESTPESWDSLQGIERTWVELEGGCHQTFALGVCSSLDTEEGFHIVNSYALAFGRKHLLADTSAEVADILDGSLMVSEKARLERGSP